MSSSTDKDAFFPYEWVDDHILVELDVDNRLHLAEATLRHAMLTVHGPRSINEAKFSQWSSELVALGLLWNTTRRTVSIPLEKNAKAKARVKAIIDRGKATKTEFYKLLGSLRHVHLSAGARTDLLWFQQILKHGHLAELPLSMFGDTAKPDVELYIDASNTGLAVLDPGTNEFIQLAFDDDELDMISKSHNDMAFSINVKYTCVLYWLCGRGGLNGIDKPPAIWYKFAGGVIIWRPYNGTQVPSRCRNDYTTYSSLFKLDHWPRHHERNTLARGRSGVNGVNGCIFRGGCLSNRKKILPARAVHSLLLRYGWGRSSTGNSASTVLSKVSHVSWYHRKMLGHGVTLLPGHQLAMTGIRREEKPASPKAPFTPDILKILHQLEPSGTNWCCPVLAAWYLVEHHKALGVDKFSLLCKINTSEDLQVRQLVTAIKSAAKATGQDLDRYGPHFLRSGGASALFNAGFDSLVVKLFGRWRSDDVERAIQAAVRDTPPFLSSSLSYG
ncbi:unnamed protein product [Phytophthora fragariaefolia]|uniref:Unnamed protein product n=1 Tax=Phytophthora fragariaefolia TaxID=1490495 RepID=A0A9W7D4C7_9STRA|nr:unnamed protein product [Phytophthora fragariaefolia]